MMGRLSDVIEGNIQLYSAPSLRCAFHERYDVVWSLTSIILSVKRPMFFPFVI